MPLASGARTPNATHRRQSVPKSKVRPKTNATTAATARSSVSASAPNPSRMHIRSGERLHVAAPAEVGSSSTLGKMGFQLEAAPQKRSGTHAAPKRRASTSGNSAPASSSSLLRPTFASARSGITSAEDVGRARNDVTGGSSRRGSVQAQGKSKGKGKGKGIGKARADAKVERRRNSASTGRATDGGASPSANNTQATSNTRARVVHRTSTGRPPRAARSTSLSGLPSRSPSPTKSHSATVAPGARRRASAIELGTTLPAAAPNSTWVPPPAQTRVRSEGDHLADEAAAAARRKLNLERAAARRRVKQLRQRIAEADERAALADARAEEAERVAQKRGLQVRRLKRRASQLCPKAPRTAAGAADGDLSHYVVGQRIFVSAACALREYPAPKHRVIGVDDAAMAARPAAVAALRARRAAYAPVERALAAVDAVDTVLEGRRDAALEAVRASVSKLLLRLEERGAELEDRVCAMAAAKAEVLAKQRRALEQDLQRLKEEGDALDRAVQNTASADTSGQVDDNRSAEALLAMLDAGVDVDAALGSEGEVPAAQAIMDALLADIALVPQQDDALFFEERGCKDGDNAGSDGDADGDGGSGGDGLSLAQHIARFGNILGFCPLAANCSAKGTGLERALCGKGSQDHNVFVVQCVDADGTPLRVSCGSDFITCIIVDADAASSTGVGKDKAVGAGEGDDAAAVMCGRPVLGGGATVDADFRIRDRDDGTYEVTYALPGDSPQAVLLHVCVRSMAIAGSPFLVACDPGGWASWGRALTASERDMILTRGAVPASAASSPGGRRVNANMRANGLGLGGEVWTSGRHCWEVKLVRSRGREVLCGVCHAAVRATGGSEGAEGDMRSLPSFMIDFKSGRTCGRAGAPLDGEARSDSSAEISQRRLSASRSPRRPLMAPAPGAVYQGDRLGCCLDLDAGTLLFYLNGKRHGPGHSGVVGPVQRCVELVTEGDAVALCNDVVFESA